MDAIKLGDWYTATSDFDLDKHFVAGDHWVIDNIQTSAEWHSNQYRLVHMSGSMSILASSTGINSLFIKYEP